MLRAESEHATVALVVVLGVACVHVQRPRLGGVLRDDVHHAARSTAAVQRRRCAFHYLDALHARHKQTREVDVVHRLACETFTVYEEEDALSAESGEIEVGPLVHRVGELYAGQLLLQQVLHVGGIGAGYVARRDDTCLYRRILQKLRCACTRHHHFLQFVMAEDGVELHIVEFWVCLRHRRLRSCEKSERKYYVFYHLSFCIFNYRRVWHLAIPTQSCEFPTDFTDLHRWWNAFFLPQISQISTDVRMRFFSHGYHRSAQMLWCAVIPRNSQKQGAWVWQGCHTLLCKSQHPNTSPSHHHNSLIRILIVNGQEALFAFGRDEVGEL